MKHIEIRDAVASEADNIHEILSQAFLPYRDQYTQQAYDITVCLPGEIRRRMGDDTIEVLVALLKGQIAGTASLHYRDAHKLYLSSMAVSPKMQGKGIGYYLLLAVEQRAQQKGCSVISLECCEFLKMAIGLYKRMGYERTGRTRPYYGVETFEMQKHLSGKIKRRENRISEGS